MKKYEWYQNRLKSMDFGEIIYRIKKTIKNMILKNRVPQNIPQFCINKKVKEHIVRLDLRSIKIDSEFCEACMKHSFQIFDVSYDYGKEIDWRLDVKNKVKNKLALWNKINYRDTEKYGDIKYIFEINKFQQLPILAFEYKKTHDKRLRSEILYEIFSWIEQNPYKMGLNWTSSIECSYRNISLLITYYLIYEDMEEEKLKKDIEKVIYLNGKYIFENLSLHSSANNHFLSELLGLFFTGILYNPEDMQMKTWIDYAYDNLLKEMQKQNYSDGVNKEQAIWYHAAVTDIYLLFFRTCEICSIKVPTVHYSLLEKMIEFIMYTYGDSQLQPNIGDRDEEIILKLDTGKDYDYFKSILTSGAVMFKRKDFKYFGSGLDNRNVFLFGNKAVSTFNQIENSEAVLKDKIFIEGGYSNLYDDSTHIIFDFGNLGYLSIAAHGHADCLSLQLFKSGKAFLIDSGTYCYHTKPEWRYYFKSTGAHNTVEVNDESQSEYGGSFLWTHKAKGKLMNYSTNNKYSVIKASQDGYKKIGVLHVRTLFFMKNKFLLVQDKIANNQKNKFTWNYHFNGGCSIQNRDKDYIITNEQESISIQFYPNNDIKTFIGWESYRLNEKHEAVTMELTIDADEDLVQYTFINLDGENRFIESANEENWILENNNKIINLQEVLV